MNQQLTKRQIEILEYFRSRPISHPPTIREIVGGTSEPKMSTSVVSYNLSSLARRGYLIKVGSKGQSRGYALKNETKLTTGQNATKDREDLFTAKFWAKYYKQLSETYKSDMEAQQKRITEAENRIAQAGEKKPNVAPRNNDLTEKEIQILEYFWECPHDTPPIIKDISNQTGLGMSVVYSTLKNLVNRNHLIEIGRKWQHQRYVLPDTSDTAAAFYYRVFWEMRKAQIKGMGAIKQYKKAATGTSKAIGEAVNEVLCRESKYWGRKAWDEKYSSGRRHSGT